MKRMILALMLASAFAVALGPGRPAQAYPEPAIVSPAWSLEFDYQQPRPIAVPDLDGRTHWYWYMPYTVTNRTGQARLFVPEIVLATDTGEIFPANYQVPRRVFDAVQRETENDLLLDPVQIVGRLQVGADYAKDGVIIWPAFEGDVDSFRIFIGGLSGETAKAQHPLTGEEVLMQRTRMLVYRTPGSGNLSPERQPVALEQDTDVMR